MALMHAHLRASLGKTQTDIQLQVRPASDRNIAPPPRAR
jgi:hypothetical protein